MTLITTTELRTKTTNLVEALLSGEEVGLVHRSKIVATIKPKKGEPSALSKRDIHETIKIAKSLNLPYLTDKQIEKRYRQAMMKKHGKHLP